MAKRGQLIPRGERKWLVRVYLGRDSQRKRKYSARTVEGTITEARQELTKMLREADTRTLVGSSKETLTDYLKRWLDGKVDIRPQTRYDYAVRINADVVSAIGHLKLHEISPLIVNELYAKLSRERGQAPRTVRYTHSILHHAFEQAVDWGLLGRNPTSRATLPRKVKRRATVLTGEQIAKLLEAAQGDSLCALWSLLLTSGLRPGEALALKWSDLRDGAVTVQRTLVRNGRGGYMILEGEAKTAESIRTVTLPPTTLQALERHKRLQANQIMALGPRYQRNDLIFASGIGTPFDLGSVRNRWKRLIAKTGLPPVRLYDTRHSHATALLTKGVNLAWVSERLGHTDVKITKEVYAHVLPEAHREMAEVMERIVARKAASDNG